MGNRAIIAFQENYKKGGSGLYLHWNGGRDSVEAFLTYCRIKGFRCEPEYGLARLAQIVGNFFGGTLSVGIFNNAKTYGDIGDNGVYVIDDKWDIVAREYFDGPEQHCYDLLEMVLQINEEQPKKEQVDPEYIRHYIEDIKNPKTYTEKIKSIKAGDMVFIEDWSSTILKCKVVGKGKSGKRVNGQDVKGVPYVDLYNNNGYESNINNYLTEGKTFFKCAG